MQTLRLLWYCPDVRILALLLSWVRKFFITDGALCNRNNVIECNEKCSPINEFFCANRNEENVRKKFGQFSATSENIPIMFQSLFHSCPRCVFWFINPDVIQQVRKDSKCGQKETMLKPCPKVSTIHTLLRTSVILRYTLYYTMLY